MRGLPMKMAFRLTASAIHTRKKWLVACLLVTLIEFIGPASAFSADICGDQKVYFRVGLVDYAIPGAMKPRAEVHGIRVDFNCVPSARTIVVDGPLILGQPSKQSQWAHDWPASVRYITITPVTDSKSWLYHGRLTDRPGQFSAVERRHVAAFLSKAPLLQGSQVIIQLGTINHMRPGDRVWVIAQYGRSAVTFIMDGDIDHPEVSLPEIEIVDRLLTKLRINSRLGK